MCNNELGKSVEVKEWKLINKDEIQHQQKGDED